jgi:hypothetical protein
MRKTITIFGTLLITAIILISGSAIAAEEFIVRVESYNNCTNPNSAVGSPNDAYATVGVNPGSLGWILLDFGLATAMGADQNFTVYGMSSGETEEYSVSIIEQYGYEVSVGSGEDTTDNVFITPSAPPYYSWRWVNITGTSGNKGDGDMIYGPEIDAVGYEP